MATLDGQIPALHGEVVVKSADLRHPAFSSNPRRIRRNYWNQSSPDRVPPYPEHKPLPYLVEARLITRAQQGDIDARNRVWETHLRLAVSVVNRFSIPPSLLHDIVQEAAIGLNRAIAKFEVDRYNAFSTYAWHWVSQHAHRALDAYSFHARVPAQHVTDIRHFRRWWESADDLGRRLPMPVKHRERLQQYSAKLLRIYRVCYPVALGHTRPDIREDPDPVHECWRAERHWILHAAFDQLSDRERIVLTARHGLDGEPERTLEAIGSALGLTRERVRQIQQTAERRLVAILQQWPVQNGSGPACAAADSAQFIEDLLE